MTKADKTAKQEARLLEMLIYEKRLWESGCEFVAGVDEVGRGPLAGPVVSAAVILPRGFNLLGVDDSKKLTPKRREELFDKIKELALCWSIGRREPSRIDEINILEATKESMLEAVNSLSIKPEHVLIDAMRLKNLSFPQTVITHGDAASVSIAAASILAKVTRDREMIEMAEIYPGYSFESNKGYGTAAHYEGLERLGPCAIHRRTFL